MPAWCSAFTMSRNSLRCEPAIAGRRSSRECGLKKRDRAVAPVVAQRLAGRARASSGVVELEDRQQLDRGDAQRLEVRDLLDDARERARMRHAARSASA